MIRSLEKLCWKHYLSLAALALILTSCGGSVVYENEATATAQAERAMEQATVMAQRLQGTVLALNEGAKATAEAREALFDTAADWPVVHADDFETNEVNWYEGSDDDPELGQIQWEVAAGRYTWQAEAYDGFVWWVVPNVEQVDDFYYAVTAQQLDGPETGEYGLLFRQNDVGGYYIFEISDLGQFAVFSFDGEEWWTLLDWSDSSAIKPGQPNTLAVIAQDSTFYLFINSELVGEIEEARLDRGQVGLMISLTNAGDTATWTFDNFELRSP